MAKPLVIRFTGWGALYRVVRSAVELSLIHILQQSGNLDTMNAIGLTGEVYVPILENAKGKVTLIVQERFTEMDAILSLIHISANSWTDPSFPHV